MIDAEKHTAMISRLDTKRILGQRAGETLRQLDPVFAEMRDLYTKQMVENTKATGEPDTYTNWCLVVLTDIETMLREKSSRGAQASRKLEKLQNAGGSET